MPSLFVPVDDTQCTALVLDQCATAFHPVATVTVGDAVELGHLGAVDMAADDTVDIAAGGLPGDRLLEIADVIDRVLDLVFQIRAASDQ